LFNAAVFATTGQNGFGGVKGDRGDSFAMTLKNMLAFIAANDGVITGTS
jgi:hypothetical protein